MLTDPAKLRQRLNTLQKQAQTLRGGHASEVVEALAEGSFRLALHPSTPPVEAFDLLRRAIRLDGANPKFIYHLARLHFAYGQFELAGRWLKEAYRLAPTSHRIWAHIALLQKELNATYRGNENFEPDSLLRRSDEITKGILAGRDVFEPVLAEFVPPKSLAKIEEENRSRQSREARPQAVAEIIVKEAPPPVPSAKRLSDPGQCRWSGVQDLSMEWLLEGAARSSNMSKLLTLLNETARLAPLRRGGVTAFAMLGIEWVIAGYPLQPVQDLRVQKLGAYDGPALQLLSHVCDLYQVPEADLPQALSNALNRGDIAPILAAIIHQRRLLWAPYEFRSLTAYRLAVKLVNEARENPPTDDAQQETLTKTANEYATRLNNAINALRNPEHQAPIKYDPPAASTAPPPVDTVEQRLDMLVSAAIGLAKCRDDAFLLIKQELEPTAQAPTTADVYSQARADRHAADTLLTAIKRAGENGQQVLVDLMSAATQLDSASVSDTFQTRSENCKKNFADLTNQGNFLRLLARIDKNLGLVAERFSITEKPPSASITAILKAIQAVELVPTAASKPVEDVSGVQSLLQQAQDFTSGLEERWRRLRDLLIAHKNGTLSVDERREGADITAYVDRALSESEETLTTIQTLRDGGQLSAQDVAMLDEAEKLYRDLLTRRGPFVKNLRQLPATPANATTPTVSPAQTQPAPKILVGLELLESKIDETHRAIEELYAGAQATFEPYSMHVRNLRPLLMLRRTLMAREAETYYRLGWRMKARRVWNAMLADERLDANVMKNIALCDSRAADLNTSLFAWRSYAELLYLYDIIGGSLRTHAQERSAFHCAVADAYAPPELLGELNKQWVESLDRGPFITFFSSAGRVRNFVNHKLLEFLNRKLDFKSPLLIIGVTRSEGVRVTGMSKPDDAARRRAAQEAPSVRKLATFTAEAAKILPRSVHGGFIASSKQYFENAALLCTNPDRVSSRRDHDYATEETRQIAWVKEIVELKFRFELVFNDPNFINDLAQHMISVDWIGELRRLDMLPLDLSDAWARAATVHIDRPLEDVLTTMDTLGRAVVTSLLNYIFVGIPKRGKKDQPEPDQEASRRQQYQRLMTEWVKRPALAPFLDFIDDPQPFYAPDVNDKSPELAISVLTQWQQRYPEITGPARYLAVLLIKAKRFQDAIKVLDVALSKGFYAKSKASIYHLRMQTWCAQAQAAAEKKANDFAAIVEKAYADADAVIKSSEDAEEISSARRVRTVFVANLYIGQGRLEDAIESLRQVNVDQLDMNTKAEVYMLRAACHFRLAEQLAKAKKRDAIFSTLEQARTYAKKSLDSGASGETATQAEQIYKVADEALTQM